MKKKENDDDDESGKKEGNAYFIKVTNIHFNPSDLLALKSNNFPYNLVQNCNFS